MTDGIKFFPKKPKQGSDGCLFGALAMLISAVISACLIAFAINAAFAHDWYPPACCSQRDCAPVDDRDITPVSGGYRVTIAPGAHPMVSSAPLDVVVPYDRWKPSPDGRFHVCLNWRSEVLCAFGPPPGV